MHRYDQVVSNMCPRTPMLLSDDEQHQKYTNQTISFIEKYAYTGFVSYTRHVAELFAHAGVGNGSDVSEKFYDIEAFVQTGATHAVAATIQAHKRPASTIVDELYLPDVESVLMPQHSVLGKKGFDAHRFLAKEGHGFDDRQTACYLLGVQTVRYCMLHPADGNLQS